MASEEPGLNDNGINDVVGCILTVKVIEATGLVAADRGGYSDPYALVSFEQQRKQTKVIKKTLNPTWNETFEFEISDPAATLLVEIYDHDLIGSHDFLGSVHISVALLVVEVLWDEWHELQPRAFRDDIVSGRLHLQTLAAKKRDGKEDSTGLECHPWIDLARFRLPAKRREHYTFRVYFSSSYVDFQEEFKALHADVFPKIKMHCESKGYTFTPVDMRNGLDDQMDKMYMYDPHIARLCFAEIEHCRNISPRVNFFAFLGDRYGCSCLPVTLDKNEMMAIRGSVNDDVISDGTSKSKEIQQLLETWYILDENQIPSRFTLRSEFQGVSAYCAPGTQKHNEWIKIRSTLFDILREKSRKLLASLRQHKYFVSLLEQEITLGLLLPEDVQEHAHCIIRGLANLRVVNPQSAKFVDIKSRCCDCMDDGIKEIRLDMIDEERRERLNDLKLRVREKVAARCRFIQAQWQGLSVTKNHIPEFCSVVLSFLTDAMDREMEQYPAQGSLKQEVVQQQHLVRKLAKSILRGKSASVKAMLDSKRLGGGMLAWQAVTDYLSSRSDGSLKPFLLQGGHGSGVSTTLAAVYECCQHEIRSIPSNNATVTSESTCMVYRHIGLTPSSMNGGKLLSGILTELKSIYSVSGQRELAIDVVIIEGLDLPAADFGGTSDPYTVLSIRNVQTKAVLEKVRAKTSVKKKTLDPQWNERFYLKGLSVDQELFLAVYDSDMLSADDLLGIASIPLASLELNKTASLTLPLRATDELFQVQISKTDLIVKVMEGEDLVPVGRRMFLDPFVMISTKESPKIKLQTAHKTRTSQPLWEESFRLTFPMTAGDCELLVEVCDHGGDNGEQSVVGHFVVDISQLQVGECVDGWYGVQPGHIPKESFGTSTKALTKVAGAAAKDGPSSLGHGRVRLVLTREAESKSSESMQTESKSNQKEKSSISAHRSEELEVETSEGISSTARGPRLRLEITLVSAARSVENAVDGKPWGGPWTYKELALAFSESRTAGLAMATATKPLIMIIDGLQNLPASDIISSLKWLPLLLPRYVHVIFGYSSDSQENILEKMHQRKPALKIVKMSDLLPSNELSTEFGYGGEYAREYLLRCLEKRRPVGNLTPTQRSSFMLWIGSLCRPLLLTLIGQIALCMPSSSEPISHPPSSSNSEICIQKAFITLLSYRVQHVSKGRVDIPRLWRVLDLLASAPTNAGGLSEDELIVLISNEKQKDKKCSVPGYFLAEILLVISPLIETRYVGNRTVYSLRHNIYKIAIKNRPNSVEMFRVDPLVLTKDFASMVRMMNDFDDGGNINVRRLLFLPCLLAESGTSFEFEQILGDLHEVELRVSAGMLWETIMELRVAGPGTSGILGEYLNLLEEVAFILDQRPYLFLQLALNMPDNSLVHMQARILDKRRRYILYNVHIPNQRAQTKSSETLKQKSHALSLLSDLASSKHYKPSSVTVMDTKIMHPLAMEWKSAKPWIKWCNKPQSREHCKLVLESQTAPVIFAIFCDYGSSIVSVCSNGSLSIWSVATGEIIQAISVLEMGYKPITSLVLSFDGRSLISGGEDGLLCCWDLVLSGAESRLSLCSKPRYVQKLHHGRVSGLAFLSSTILVSCGDDKEVRIINALTGNEINSFTPFRLPITSLDCSVAFGEHHGLIATGSLSSVKIWRGDTFEFRGSLYSPLQNRVSALKFCPRPNISPIPALVLAVAEWAADIFLWKQVGAQRWMLAWKLSGHTGPVLSLTWSRSKDTENRDKVLLASTGIDCSIFLWSIESEYCLDESLLDEENEHNDVPLKPAAATIMGHTSTVRSVSFHPVGTLIVSSSQDGAVLVWDTNAVIAAAAASTTAPAIRHAGAVASVAVAKMEDQLLIISGGADSRAKLWGLQGGRDKWEMLASVEVRHVSSLTSVSLTASGRFFLTGSADGVIKRWESTSPNVCSGQVKAHRGGVARLKSHPIGDYLLSCGRTDGRVTLWDVDSMQDVAIMECPTSKVVLQAAFSNDGRMVITADPKAVRLWSVELSREILSLPIGEGGEWSLADFSSDGRFLVTAGTGHAMTNNFGLIVWDASKGLKREGKLTARSPGDEDDDVVSISMSADARYICASFESRWIHVWHLPSRTWKGSYFLSGDPSPALCTDTAWPYIVAADTGGSLYILEFVSPEPPKPSEGTDSDDEFAGDSK